MKTSLNKFLKAALEKGYNLQTLISLTKAFPNHLNPEVEVNALQELGFVDSLDQFPDPRVCNFLDLENIRKYAEFQNKLGEGIPNEGLIKGKTL
jgi:hypothetical protein